MRLKTLFFPIMLVISVSIFIGYVWPEILRIKSANEIKVAKTQELQEINAKKVAIESIGKEISSTDSEKTIKDYLPENRTEERIISGVNYLAGDANVSLANISLSNEKIAVVSDAGIPAGIVGALNPVAGADALIAAQVASGAPVTPTSDISQTSADISVVGDYEKIRVFLNGLRSMPMFNNIKTLTISKQKSSTGEVVVGDNALVANLTVDFGYMNIAKVDTVKVASFKQNIDDETIDILKKFVSQKSQFVDVVDNGSKGKVNPFVSN